MDNFRSWEENFIRWANNAEKGSKSMYAEVQPCRVPARAHLVRDLVDMGLITVTSKKTGEGKKTKWKAWAIKC